MSQVTVKIVVTCIFYNSLITICNPLPECYYSFRISKMNKNGRGDNRTRRRGNNKRKQYISIAVAIVVIYVVYKTFMPDSDNAFEHKRGTQIAEKAFVQKEIRTVAPKIVQPPNTDAADSPIDTNGDIEIDEETGDVDGGDVDVNDTVKSIQDGAAEDKYNVQKSLEERNDTGIKELNATLTKANLTHAPENGTNPSQVKMTLLEQNKTDIKELNTTLTKTNLTYTPIKRMDPFLSNSNGSISGLTPKLNISAASMTVDVQTNVNDTVRETKDIEAYKMKLAEGFAAQTKELANLVQNALNKKVTNLTDANWQNKIEPVDRNLTKLVELFSSKAQDAMKLAKDLLFNKSAGVPDQNQNTSGLNKTKIEGTFSVQTKDLVNIANRVLADTDKSASETRNEIQAKILDKYAFDAQNLAKFASTLIANATTKVIEAKQKLVNLDIPLENKLPYTNDVKNMTETILS